MAVEALLTRMRNVIATRPLVRGMISYSILWPTSCLIQQTIEKQKFGDYDWKRAFHYSVYGSLYIAPTLYGYMKLANHMWPVVSLRTGIYKALIDQLSYGPFATTSFYTLMTLMENKSWEEACTEVRMKFFPTYKVELSLYIIIPITIPFKVGLCFWPIMHTINYSFIPEKNRLIYVSMCSLIWTTILATIKQMKAEHLAEFKKHHPLSETE